MLQKIQPLLPFPVLKPKLQNLNHNGLESQILHTNFRRIGPMVLEENIYTPGIYAEGYIVFVFPFVRSYVRMFVCSFVRSYFLPSRGICVKVLR